MKRQYLRDLKAGISVDTILYCSRRDIKERRDGGSFLTFELRDRTGSVNAIMWDRIDDALRCVEPGGFYHVQGRLGEYQGRPQLNVTAIYPAAPDEIVREDFTATTRYDRGELMKELSGYVAAVKDHHLRGLLESFFNDAQFAAHFAESPAAASVHHAFIGGLLEHTVLMCRMAAPLPGIYRELNGDLLMAGVILHDIGKIDEYVYDMAIDHTWDGRLIGHIVMGHDMVRERIATLPDFPEELARMLLHIIVSHHGQMEFGSPKTPKFAEALVVHFLDNLDARVAMFREAVDRNQGVKWTDYHPYLETNVYIGERGKPGPA
ncbi:MAG: OB-fold nucleic acid binding domain-containing protein [bacterium]